MQQDCSGSSGAPLFLAEGWEISKDRKPSEKLGKAIAYAIYDGHAYFYKSGETVANWIASQGAGSRQVVFSD